MHVRDAEWSKLEALRQWARKQGRTACEIEPDHKRGCFRSWLSCNDNEWGGHWLYPDGTIINPRGETVDKIVITGMASLKVTFTNPRLTAEFSEWPSGQRKVPCRFEVHRDARRGCRVSRTTTGKPKYTTYATGGACIVDGSDGRTYILMHSPGPGMASVRIVDSDLQHDAPEDRLGCRAAIFGHGEDAPIYADLVALIAAAK